MDNAHAFAEAELKKLERKFRRYYKQAHKEMEKKLKEFGDSFSFRDKAMQKKVKDGIISQKAYNTWRQKEIMLSEAWVGIRDQLANDYLHANQIAAKAINDTLPSVFAEGCNYATYQIDQMANISMSFALYDMDTVVRLIKDEPQLLPIKAGVKVAKDKKWNQRKITSAVTQGILQGESMDGIAARLRKVTDMNRAVAMRNARTAVTGAENAGRLHGYNRAMELGIKMQKQWLSVHDGRTRHTHRQVDGEVMPVKERFSNGCMYPADPLAEPAETYNCRCTMIPAIEGHEIDVMSEIDTSYMGMTYDEWKMAKAPKPKVESAKEPKGGTTREPKGDFVARSYQYHVDNNYEKSVGLLDDAEYNAVRVYTGSSYTQMNGYLRGKYTREEVGRRIVNYCKNAIEGLNKTRLAHDVRLFRGMGSRRTLARATGLSAEELERAIKDGSLRGMEFTEKGFCSCGIDPESGWDKEVAMEICARKGTNGMFVDPFSIHEGERECLLNAGMRFEIYDYEMLETVLLLKCVII